MLSSALDPRTLIETLGYAGVTAIVLAEDGLFFCFFFPGDSLLFTAGFLASQGLFNIVVLSLLAVAAAIVGDSIGYAFGQQVGQRFFTRDDSLLFKRRHLERAHAFYEVHGGKAIILARFIPGIRTFAPIVAGMAEMSYPRFLAFNVVGGVLWALGLTSAGYFLGSAIPDVDKYLLPIVALIIVLSILPGAYQIWRENRRGSEA